MTDTTSNKTIAKNTIYLYFRSFLMMAINLYSSRVILQALGINDYGLYGAIGSIVAMFTMINGVLAAGTSRFLTFELGKGDKERLRKTFSASFAMHTALAVILFILLEVIGVWFLNNKMNIPDGREYAANVVFQLSILSCIFSLIQVPYSACIIAHERMGVYAYIGIAEAVFKLALIFALLYIPFKDNLIAYAAILAIWSICLQIWYMLYCRSRFEESKLTIVRDKYIYKGMLSYSMWDFMGQFCATGNSQGLNILLNMFFGVSVNAGRAVAYQVENAITQFSTNFMTAVTPQITKSYAQNDIPRFLQLVKESSRFSFYLLFVISLPIFLEAEYILSIWLVEVPDTAIYFLRFVIYYTLFRVSSIPFVKGVHATGNIKYLNLSAGLYSVTTFLSAIFICYKLGAPFWACFIVQGFNGFILTYFELNALYKNVRYNRLEVIKDVFLIPWSIVGISSILPALCVICCNPGITRLFLTTTVSIVSTIVIVYFFGLTKGQRVTVLNVVRKKLNKVLW